ncbi:hypothetical protein ACFFQF_32870 [Haladaptatus pallidirubidus]|uniref:hypothetical protein n=1 Tax=Haladaptatus pallidirubidus TaxID=1008152 RepID=UPI001D120804|nr:hypothetical protein [Haladaptatus pallidirubidus]
MSFETIYLSIEKEAAHEIVSQSVDGIQSKTVDGSIEYRDMGGMLLAVLSDAASKRSAKAKLRYQTSVLMPLLAHNRVKAREIRDSVAEYHFSK